MIDFTEIEKSGEIWELFARDFFSELGFIIESSPNRGADGGKDLIIKEIIRGQFSNHEIRWLVSCKHYAHSGNSINETIECNIIDRLTKHNCNGFIAFYSTIPSSGLHDALDSYKQKYNIKIFDHKVIESYLINMGLNKLLMRYFPDGYKKIKPLHKIYGEYLPLNCDSCDTDLLLEMYKQDFHSNIVFMTRFIETDEGEVKGQIFQDIKWICKPCDQERYGEYSGWEDIHDLVTPSKFMDWIISWINDCSEGRTKIAEQAKRQLFYFIRAIGQKAFREMTNEEFERYQDLLELPSYL